MQTIYAPNYTVGAVSPTVFLAGSIEMGKAEDWQAQVTEMLKESEGTILNPRRPDWDNTWGTSPTDEPFRTQVIWEQYGICFSDIVFFNFCPGTSSPISLLELGTVLGRRSEVVVCCPKEFSRYGNVAITCEMHHVMCHNNLEVAVKHLKSSINRINYWKNTT